MRRIFVWASHWEKDCPIEYHFLLWFFPLSYFFNMWWLMARHSFSRDTEMWFITTGFVTLQVTQVPAPLINWWKGNYGYYVVDISSMLLLSEANSIFYIFTLFDVNTCLTMQICWCKVLLGLVWFMIGSLSATIYFWLNLFLLKRHLLNILVYATNYFCLVASCRMARCGWNSC